jgi:general secretion pathway protein J
MWPPRSLAACPPGAPAVRPVRRRPLRHLARGFTLIEVLVALSVMALLALLSWRGLDGMARVQADMRERVDGVVSVQTGLSQWSSDLDAVVETALVSGIDYDGRVLRLTRRDASLAGSPLRVVGWARRVIDGAQDGRAAWARWQSQPLRTRAELQEAWEQVANWAQSPSAADKQREVAVLGLDQWQIFYYRNNAWTNPLSSASATGVSAAQVAAVPVPAIPAIPAIPASGATTSSTAIPPPAPTGIGLNGSALVPLPDGIRLILSLSAGQPLTGVLTKDWLRSGKS